MPRGKGGKSGNSGTCFLCARTCSNRCPNCRLVYYCSKDHYVYHRQRDYCFPYRISWNELGGAHSVVATRKIRPLELILFEWNLVVGPGLGPPKSREDACTECLRPTSAKNRCSKCGLIVCPQHDGSQKHEESAECSVLSRADSEADAAWKAENVESLILAVMPIRLLVTVKNNIKVRERFGPLRSNMNSRQTDSVNASEWEEDKEDILRFLEGRCHFTDPDLSWSLDLLRSSSISSESLGGGGARCFFPIFSLMSHSCRSNSKFIVYPSHKVAVLAQTAIDAGDEITVSRVPVLEPTWKRRAMLFREHLFFCQCSRCRDPTEFDTNLSALRCPKCDDGAGAILPEDPTAEDTVWSCKVHRNIKMSSKAAQQLALDLQVDLYSSGLTTTLRRLEQSLRDLSAFLHPHHGLLMTLKRSLMLCYSQAKQGTLGRAELERMKNIAMEQITILEKVDPGYPDWRGSVLKHYSTAELFLTRMDFDAGLIGRPEFLLRCRKAACVVQEGLRCTACIKVDRSIEQVPLDQYVDEMSADSSSYMSDASCCSELD